MLGTASGSSDAIFFLALPCVQSTVQQQEQLTLTTPAEMHIWSRDSQHSGCTRQGQPLGAEVSLWINGSRHSTHTREQDMKGDVVV